MSTNEPAAFSAEPRPAPARSAVRASAAARLVAVVAAGTVWLSLGGCVVASGERSPTSAKVEQMRQQGRVEFDLSVPPSRQEAGLAEGRSEVAYELADRGPFEVRVRLPGARELGFAARLAVFDSVDAPDPATGPPTTLDLHHYPASLEAGRDHLLAAAAQFGLDQAPIDQWYGTASGDQPAQAPSTVATPWLGAAVGYLQLEIQGRYTPPVDTPESDQTVVHYSLTWLAPGTTDPP